MNLGFGVSGLVFRVYSLGYRVYRFFSASALIRV